jgi:hypothetical protein
MVETVGDLFLSREGRIVAAGDAMTVVAADSQMIPLAGGGGTLPLGAGVVIHELLNAGTGLVLAEGPHDSLWWLKPHECLAHVAPEAPGADQPLPRAIQAMIRAERDAPGLTLLQFIILSMLQQRTDGVGVQNMTDAIGVHRSAVEAAVAGMPQLVRNLAADLNPPGRTLHATALCRRWIAETSGAGA